MILCPDCREAMLSCRCEETIPPRSLSVIRSEVPSGVIARLETALAAAKQGRLEYCVALFGVDRSEEECIALPVHWTREGDMYRALGLCGMLEHQIRRLTDHTTEESSA